MPHHTYKDTDGVEWDVVQIPALIAHGNKMLMIKTQGCWELDYSSDRQIAQLIEQGYNHNGCVSGSMEVLASMFHFDKYGFTRSVRKVRVTPQDPDRHYSPVTVHGVDIEEGHEVQTAQEIGVQPGSLPDVPLDSGGLPLSNEVRGTGRTRPRPRLPYPTDGILREFRQEVASDLDRSAAIRDLIRNTYGHLATTEEALRLYRDSDWTWMSDAYSMQESVIQSTPLTDMELPVTESSIQDMATDDSERF